MINECVLECEFDRIPWDIRIKHIEETFKKFKKNEPLSNTKTK